MTDHEEGKGIGESTSLLHGKDSSEHGGKRKIKSFRSSISLCIAMLTQSYLLISKCFFRFMNLC